VRCSFCGRVGNQGVMGSAAFICFECIELAAEIKSESLGDRKSGTVVLLDAWIRHLF